MNQGLYAKVFGDPYTIRMRMEKNIVHNKLQRDYCIVSDITNEKLKEDLITEKRFLNDYICGRDCGALEDESYIIYTDFDIAVGKEQQVCNEISEKLKKCTDEFTTFGAKIKGLQHMGQDLIYAQTELFWNRQDDEYGYEFELRGPLNDALFGVRNITFDYDFMESVFAYIPLAQLGERYPFDPNILTGKVFNEKQNVTSLKLMRKNLRGFNMSFLWMKYDLVMEFPLQCEE